MVEPDQLRFSAALATELDAAKLKLEELATELCLDPMVFERHAAPLQQFDALAQVLAEVAGALRHPGPADGALAAVRLDAVRDRLARHL